MAESTVLGMPTEFAIAAVGAVFTLFGTVIGAIFTNWDKIFGRVLTAKIVGYSPTNDYETEFRHYFNVSGLRRNSKHHQENVLEQVRQDLRMQRAGSDEKINAYIEDLKNTLFSIDEIIPKILPVYKKYIDIEELHRLNEFYSTKDMQELQVKVQCIIVEMAPIQYQVLQEEMEKIHKSVRKIFGSEMEVHSPEMVNITPSTDEIEFDGNKYDE